MRDSAGSGPVQSLLMACPVAGARGTTQTVVLAAVAGGGALGSVRQVAMQCYHPEWPGRERIW